MTRVVVTGFGAVSAAGNDSAELWATISSGRCAIGPVVLSGASSVSGVGGQIRSFQLPGAPPGFGSRLHRSTGLAVTAAKEAVASSRLGEAQLQSLRMGIVVGTCQGLTLDDGGVPDEHWAPWSLYATTLALAAVLDARGPLVTVSTACTAGSCAITIGRELLLAGHADVVLAGGTDSLSSVTWAGFEGLRALDERSCSPYGRSDGLNLGEGAGMLVLETAAGAMGRGARVVADLLGCGLSADAFHPTAPEPSGRGAMLAMSRALAQGGLASQHVDYVNGHGTGTVPNDSMERQAMRSFFGARAHEVPISSTKSAIGHALGAAGALEAIVTLSALTDGLLPPTLNFPPEVDGSELDFVPNEARPKRIHIAMSNNYAFGGNNSSLLFGRPGRPPSVQQSAPPSVVITGLGAAGPLGLGVLEWERRLSTAQSAIGPIQTFDPSPYRCRQAAESPSGTELPRKASSAEWRRMDGFSRLAMVSSRLAWEDSCLASADPQRDDIALLFATNSGPQETIFAFDRLLRVEKRVNPLLFSNAALCAPAGHVCTAMGFRGPTATMTAGGTSAIVALAFAAGMIRRREIVLALVLAGDDLCEATIASADRVDGLLTDESVRPFDGAASGTVLGGGTIALVVESSEHARERHARAYCEVLDTGFASRPSPALQLRASEDAWLESMGQALERSGVLPNEVGFCAAAASGVASLDAAEARGLHACLGPDVPVGAAAGTTGLCLGASGAVGLLACALAFRYGRLAATANLERPLREAPLHHVRPGERADGLENCLVNAAALGGTYASAVLARWTSDV